jgi:single-stranded DNA-binding protein
MHTNEVRLSGIIDKVTTRQVGQKNTLLLEVDLKQEIPGWNGELTTQVVRCQSLGRQAQEISDSLHEGQAVRINGKLDGREWNDKIFINCTIQSVEVMNPNEERQDHQLNQQPSIDDMEVPF